MSNVRFGLPRSAFDRVIAAALRDGYQLTLEEKSGWTKIQGPAGPRGPRVYVPKRETVRQVDLSGFGAGWKGTIPPAAKNGNVQAHIDLEGDDVWGTFADALKLVALAPRAASSAPAPASRTTGAPTPGAELDPEEIARRRADVIARSATSQPGL